VAIQYTTTINKSMPVSSVVIYLRKDRKIEEPPYIEKLPNGNLLSLHDDAAKN
jgi:hypothetical protein